MAKYVKPKASDPRKSLPKHTNNPKRVGKSENPKKPTKPITPVDMVKTQKPVEPVKPAGKRQVNSDDRQ